MKSKLITALLVGTCVALAACNTVRGASADVGSAANCTQNAMHGGRCYENSLNANKKPRRFIAGGAFFLPVEVSYYSVR